MPVKGLEQNAVQFTRNSSNSHKPPSSDDVTKPKPKPRKGPFGSSPRGEQPGHPRHERVPFAPEMIDLHRHHVLAYCPECGGDGLILLGLCN